MPVYIHGGRGELTGENEAESTEQKRDRKMRGDGWIRVVDGDGEKSFHLCIPHRESAWKYACE